MFKPTYLYIKTHNKTNLKYFGKTVQNPYTYKGSGHHWTRHIKKHGNDVTTEILGYYTDEDECRAAALEFSIKHNITESAEWANLRDETLDGGDTSRTDRYRQWLPRLSEENKTRRWWNNGSNQVFAPTPPDDSYVRGRLAFNNVGSTIGASIQKNKIWVNNGREELMIEKSAAIPNGYSAGRLNTRAFAGGTGRHSAKGTKWWNNGTVSKMTKDSPGPEWTEGRILSPSRQQ